MATKDQQIRHVVEGLALGVLAQGVVGVTSAKVELELGFDAAWRRWANARYFPSLSGRNPGNLFWIGVGKSERRVGALAAWRKGQWATPYVKLEGWTPDDCLDIHADERASVEAWKELGLLYVAAFKPDQLLLR